MPIANSVYDHSLNYDYCKNVRIACWPCSILYTSNAVHHIARMLNRLMFILIRMNAQQINSSAIPYILFCGHSTVSCMWIIRAAQRNVKIWQLTRKIWKRAWLKTIVLIHIYVLRNAHKHSTNDNVTQKRKQFRIVRTHTTIGLSRMYESKEYVHVHTKMLTYRYQYIWAVAAWCMLHSNTICGVR